MANEFPVRLLDRPLPPSLPLGSLGRYLGGLGPSTLASLLGSLGFSPTLPLGLLPPPRLRLLEELLRPRRLGRSVLRFRLARIADKRRSGSYFGIRHGFGLPVRGQRTHSNGRTARRSQRSSA